MAERMDTYSYPMSELVRAARTITPETEAQAEAVYQVAKDRKLPVGYIVKAVARCNQLDVMLATACDWSAVIEVRSEKAESVAKRAIFDHLRHAHPYLGIVRARMLAKVAVTNLRDFGR